MILLTVFLITLIVIILILGTFLFLPLELGLEITKTADKNDIFLRFKFLKIPFKVRINAKKNKKRVEMDSKIEEKKLSFKSFKQNISLLKDIYNTKKQDLKDMLSYTRRHLAVNQVDFEIRFGFDNAAATGISTGAIWGMGSFLLKVIDSLIGINKINMQVNPDFNNKIFEIYSKTILIIRPIHLIIIVGQVLKTLNHVNNTINNTIKERV